MSDIFELAGEDPEDEPFEELPVDRWFEFDDPEAPTLPPNPRDHDEERFNDEGCTPGGWAKSPTC